MILPTKHISSDRALLAVGADIMRNLREPKTVSRLWDEFRTERGRLPGTAPVSYEWFVLTLDLLFLVGAVVYERGQVRRERR